MIYLRFHSASLGRDKTSFASALASMNVCKAGLAKTGDTDARRQMISSSNKGLTIEEQCYALRLPTARTTTNRLRVNLTETLRLCVRLTLNTRSIWQWRSLDGRLSESGRLYGWVHACQQSDCADGYQGHLSAQEPEPGRLDQIPDAVPAAESVHYPSEPRVEYGYILCCYGTWLYVLAIIDVYSRCIVCWGFTIRLRRSNAIEVWSGL